jgi:hypothetical protein
MTTKKLDEFLANKPADSGFRLKRYAACAMCGQPFKGSETLGGAPRLVDVVECQDCRFGRRFSTPDEHRVECHWPSGPESGLHRGDHEPNWYCPRGERGEQVK